MSDESTHTMVGRFAPSPTGPLHIGSLLAAVGSWLFARSVGGQWLVRMEDLDTPRVRPGAADEILTALELYGLYWDGVVEYQSRRHGFYADALSRLRAMNAAYDCACSRADLQRAASAPAASDPVDAHVYPGTCRDAVPTGKPPRAVRFHVVNEVITFEDRIRGSITENTAMITGDFVVKRADGIWAYQLAVVVDDFAQGVTEVVRGGDLLDSTARQIALQRALGYGTPSYAHLPLLVDGRGAKIGKRHGALSLPLLDETRMAQSLTSVLAAMGCGGVTPDTPRRMLDAALARFDAAALRAAQPVIVLTEQNDPLSAGPWSGL